MRRFAWYLWKFGLPLLVVAAVGYYLYDKLSRPELWTHAFRLRPEWLVPAALLYLCAHSVWARYSVTLLRNQGGKVSVSTGVRAYFISQFGKYVPGKVWVILLRMSILGRSLGITRTAVGITAMYEALVSMAAGAMIGVLLLYTLSAEQSGLAGYNLYWLAPIALTPIGLVGLNRFVNRVNRWRKGVHAKQYPRVKLHLVLGGLLQASVGWFLLGLSLWMTLRGLQADPDPLTWETYLHLTSINALAYVIGFVAFFMPAGAGFRELALQTLLTLELSRDMDTTAAAALAAVTAIVLRLIWTIAELTAAGLLYHFAKTHPPLVIDASPEGPE
jgi:glycosyltransferase 2 family protein